MVVIQCVFSRYVVLYPVPENNDTWIIKSLLNLFGHYGLVRCILSDNGKLYSGVLIQKLAAHLQVKQKFTPAYHPQANGLVERFMSTLRNMIVSYMDLQKYQYYLG